MGRRGIVVGSFRVDKDGVEFGSPFLDGCLRRYATYWDCIDFPTNNYLHLRPSTDVAFLENAGVLVRTPLPLNPHTKVLDMANITNAQVLSQFHAFELHEREEPGCWAIAQESSAGLFHPESGLSVARVVEVELCNALPEPASNVSLDSVLAFKRKRADELMAFRAALDSICAHVSASGDIARATAAAENRIKLAVADLQRSMSEGFATRLLRSIKVEFNPTVQPAVAVGVSALAHASFGLGPISTAIAGGLATAVSMVKVELATRQTPVLTETNRAFAYLCGIATELH